jgi:hypothetical protein
MYDHFSWSMIGMVRAVLTDLGAAAAGWRRSRAKALIAQAVRLAQDMSLHKEDTYYRLADAEVDEATWKARRRFSVWICECASKACDGILLCSQCGADIADCHEADRQ